MLKYLIPSAAGLAAIFLMLLLQNKSEVAELKKQLQETQEKQKLEKKMEWEQEQQRIRDANWKAFTQSGIQREKEFRRNKSP